MKSNVEARSHTVSVAIVNHNGKHYLRKTIDLVYQNCPDIAEIILVDNLSTDGSLALVENHYPHVQILARAVNDGPGQARNLAIKSAKSDFVLVLDNDVAPCLGCLSYLANALQRDPEAVVAMPSIVYDDRPTIVQFAGAEAHFMGSVAPLACNVSVTQQDMKTASCTSLISAAFMVNKRLLGDHLLFNECLFIYQEDHEAGFRCGAFGLELLTVPVAQCLHREGTVGLSIRSTGSQEPIRRRHTVFNRWYVLLTLYQWHTLLRFLPALICFEVISFAGALLQGWVGDWLWAAKEIVKKFPQIRSQRRVVQNSRVLNDTAILRGGPFPFNTETQHSRLQRAGEWIVNSTVRLNWWLTRSRRIHHKSSAKNG